VCPPTLSLAVKKMKPQDRLSNEHTYRGNVHPALLTPSRFGRTADPRVRFLPPTAAMKKPPAINRPRDPRRPAAPVVQPSNLVMGVSSAVHTPSQSPAAFRSGIRLSTPEKVEARKTFEFKSEPMRNLPATASKFVSHPTLTGLPEHFTHPPLRPGLFASVRDYLEGSRKEDDRKRGQFTATPIQRLVLGHFFPPRAPPAANAPANPAKGNAPAGTKLAEWQAQKKDWLPRGMLPGSKTLFAAETGSGKTLAYILPVVQSLKESEESRMVEKMARNANELPWAQDEAETGDEAESSEGGAESSVRIRPRALILAPTHELARQIAGTFKALVHNEKLRVGCLSTGASSRDNTGLAIPKDCDILVGTMNRVRDLMGLSTLRDSQPDKKAKRREEETLARMIKREEEQASKWSDGPWRGKGLPPTEGRERWMPDKRLTWLENLRAREAANLTDEDAGDEKPSWSSRALRLTGETRERKSRKVLSLDQVEWLVLDEADVALSMVLRLSSARRPRTI
jgi:hypothetical protein